MRTTRKQFPVNWLTSGRLAFTIQRAKARRRQEIKKMAAQVEGRCGVDIHLLTRPRFGAESSGSQPGYRKLFPHAPHSSKNNFFRIKISQRRDWECPSLSYYGSWFEPTSHFKSRLSLIVRVNLVLNRTVVVDSDQRFDNLCGSHLPSQSELCHVIIPCIP